MPLRTPTLDDLRRHAVARTLFTPTTLPQAITRLGFVQADPIRAPARAQDLTLRHRVRDYHAGDLERRYPRLAVEEDFFVNYGFLPRATQQLMHPRTARTPWPKTRWAQAHAVLEFVRARGVVHPREVDAAFDHGTTRNWFGGNSRASTQLLDGMHYRGLLRVAGRDGGVRLYAARAAHDATDPAAALDALVDLILRKYAPLPLRSFSELVSHLRAATPQWADQRAAALARAKERLPQAVVGAASPGSGPPASSPRRAATRPTTPCGCWHPSTPSSGTAAASSCCGAGPTASRPTRRRRNACAATTRCRCCGARRSSAGATCRCSRAGWCPISATSPASRRAAPRSAPRSTTSWAAWPPS